MQVEVVEGSLKDCGHLHAYDDPAAKKTKLQEILAQRYLDVAEAKARVSAEDLKLKADAFVHNFGPPQALPAVIQEAESTRWALAFAAEFKRASPSKGVINADLNPVEQALEYAKVGASVLSVLTEPKWFKGSLDDLKDIRVSTQQWAQEQSDRRRPACLRKDFIVDEYQVLEALAHGADTILLMVSILPLTRLHALIACCREYGMEPLVEVVTEKELEVALDAGAHILGVNNRNLHTFELDKTRTATIAKLLRDSFKVEFGPGHRTKLLALSGLSTAEDVQSCRCINCSGVLVGEALMRAADPGAAINEMMEPPAGRALPVAPGAVVVKVCGVRRPSDASCAMSGGANLIGVIFAQSKRQASLEQASSIVDTVRKFGERTKVVPVKPTEKDSGFATRCDNLRRACKRTPLVVGVFMDQPLAEVVQKADSAGVDVVQLHGGEVEEFVAELRDKLPNTWIIKVVHLPAQGAERSETEEALRQKLVSFAQHCDSLLLDTSIKGAHAGGTGQTFDWNVARRAQNEWGIPVIVAGGLTDGNVGDLVSSVCPFGVDVASGVEDAPGVKNAEKTLAYVQKAKRARVLKPEELH